MKDTLFYAKRTFNFKGILRVYDRPLVMGILNVTPDSFYAGSRVAVAGPVLEKVAAMLTEGADLVDIGGYSSRPGASDIPEEEELQRVVPVIREIHAQFPDLLLSVDTFRSRVADEALKNGASVVNDISGGMIDPRIHEVAASHGAPYILMHMKGTPQTMTGHTHYDNLLKDILYWFSERIGVARSAGVKDIILDPGFGFSKTIDQNFELLAHLEQFHLFDFPLLVGLSRKSTVYRTLGVTPDESLNGTTVLNTVALMKGASILRVHDVKEALEAVQLIGKMS